MAAANMKEKSKSKIMKNKLFIQPLIIAFIAITGILAACQTKTDSLNTTEQENTVEAANMDIAISNMLVYNDSCVIAKLHASNHLHHYDSVYHHHDSLYDHHHTSYHHGDTVHHHMDWHHNTNQHHKHDSLNNDHHKRIH